MRRLFLVFAFILLMVAYGCGGTAPSSSSAGVSSSNSGIDRINRAEMNAKSFFYIGECDQKCEDIKEEYYSIIEEADDLETRSRARRRLSEFLFRIKEYDEGITVAKGLMDTADNNKDWCEGMILIAQNARAKKDYELAFDAFNSAKKFCEEDKQEFLQENMCYLTEQAGDLEGAKMMCPWKYS